MMTYWRSQFDKILMTALFTGLCILALVAVANDKLSTFALQSAAGCLGCLLTLVTSRKTGASDLLTSDSDGTTAGTKTVALTATTTTVNGEKLPAPAPISSSAPVTLSKGDK